MNVKQYTVELSDGRELLVADYGKDGNPVIITHNGTPSASGFLTVNLEDAQAKGIRLINYNRPGYGESTRLIGRDIASAAKDIAELADFLGIDRFAVYGMSGGGPHALACGVLLTDRVVGVACISGIAPYEAEGLDYFDGMGEENIDEFGATLKGESDLMSYLKSQIPPSSQIDPKALAEHMKSILCEEDLLCFVGRTGIEIAKQIIEGMQKGLYGWLDDDLAFVKPWGFQLNDVQVPVQIWQGSKDLMVPFSHGKWLCENIPSAERHLLDNEGHISTYIKHIPEIHDYLLSKF